MTVPSIVDSMRALIELSPAPGDAWVGDPGALGLPRIFGGHVLAQSLLVAARTVPAARSAHSLHAYFLRAGDPARPITYRVKALRDGRRLSVREVTADQGAAPIAVATLSFADTDGIITHQRRPPVAVPAVDLPTLAEATQRWGGLSPAWLGFDLLEMRVEPRQATVHDDIPQWTDHVWQRVPEALGEDPVLHQALLVYASDVVQLAAALVPHGIALGREVVDGLLWDGVSLDHAIWFPRPARADEWLLFEQVSPVAAAGRAYTRTEVFTTAGELVASIAQEGLVFDPVEETADPSH